MQRDRSVYVFFYSNHQHICLLKNVHCVSSNSCILAFSYRKTEIK